MRLQLNISHKFVWFNLLIGKWLHVHVYGDRNRKLWCSYTYEAKSLYLMYMC